MSDDGSREKSIELPHGAWYDPTSGFVTFAIDRMTLSFTIEEFSDFIEQVTDISDILFQMVQTEGDECPTCGSRVEVSSVVPPDDSDYN